MTLESENWGVCHPDTAPWARYIEVEGDFRAEDKQEMLALYRRARLSVKVRPAALCRTEQTLRRAHSHVPRDCLRMWCYLLPRSPEQEAKIQALEDAAHQRHRAKSNRAKLTKRTGRRVGPYRV